jgi:DNA-binding MarR family transcriptional regulator
MMVEQKPRPFVAGDAAQIVSRVVEGRLKRREFFSSDLFADAAWDVLLILFLAQLEERDAGMRDLRFSSPVPASTMKRWVRKLELEGWIRQKGDPSDPACRLLELSGAGTRAMQAWLKDWVEHRSSSPDDDRVRDLLERIERGRRET